MKKEGRYPTGFEKQVYDRSRRRNVLEKKLTKMPTIMEISRDDNDDLSEMNEKEQSVSIKLSIKETIVNGSIYKSATSSQKKYSRYFKNQ